jgi:hypothetical protein
MELARFAVVFEGYMFTLRGHWGKCRITELTDEVRLSETVLFFQNRNHYRGKVVSIERLYRSA